MWNNINGICQIQIIMRDDILEISLYDNGPWVLGSSSECELPIRPPGVSPLHIELWRENEELHFKGLASDSDIALDGKRTTKGILKPGSILSFCGVILRIKEKDDIDQNEPGSNLDAAEKAATKLKWEVHVGSASISNQNLDYNFMFKELENFLQEGRTGNEGKKLTLLLRELLECQAVRYYEWNSEKLCLVASEGDFPSEHITKEAIESITSASRVAILLEMVPKSPIYYVSFPIQFENRKSVYLCAAPRLGRLLIEDRNIIPIIFMVLRLVAKWSSVSGYKERSMESLQEQIRDIRTGVDSTPDALEPIVGKSPRLLYEIETADRIALTDMHIMIYGATGTGKELFARRIHKKSRRSSGPFIAINCASIPETLLESELFGVERGAFTGADKNRTGLFEKANGGTILLDEIGNLPLALQPKLLRVLEEKQLTPLGSSKVHPIDVRILAATNQDLFSAIGTGRFRQDLFYRLTEGIPIRIPPLAERGDDILLLANFFMMVANREFGKNVRAFEDSAVQVLKNFQWPGNVRQLQGLVKHMVLLCGGSVITSDLAREVISKQVIEDPSVKDARFWDLPLAEAKDSFEKEYLTRRLASSGGSLSALARELGIARPNLYLKLKRWGLKRK